MLKKLSDNFDSIKNNTVTIKKNQSEMKNSLTEMKNVAVKVNSKWDEAGNWIIVLEDKVAENKAEKI